MNWSRAVGRFPGLQSGSLHLFILVMVVIGGLVAYSTRYATPPSDVVHREECRPVVWHASMDQRGWELLQEQGYTARADDGEEALYPPGCESVR